MDSNQKALRRKCAPMLPRLVLQISTSSKVFICKKARAKHCRALNKQSFED